MSFTNLALDLLLPTKCCVCGKLPMLLCPGCEPSYLPRLHKGDSEVWFATEYTDEFAKIINSYKENGRVALAKHLVVALDQLLNTAFANAEFSEIAYVQSSRSNLRKRGFNPMKLLLSHSKFASGCQLVELKLTRKVSDQSNLNREQRIENLAGAYRATRALERVLLVDDVRTTGSTLGAMATAVEDAGGTVAGRAVLAMNF